MQEEIYEFDRLDIWELVPPPECAMIIALKWIFKVKLDEHGDVLKDKAQLVAKNKRELTLKNRLHRLLVLRPLEYFSPMLLAGT